MTFEKMVTVLSVLPVTMWLQVVDGYSSVKPNCNHTMSCFICFISSLVTGLQLNKDIQEEEKKGANRVYRPVYSPVSPLYSYHRLTPLLTVTCNFWILGGVSHA